MIICGKVQRQKLHYSVILLQNAGKIRDLDQKSVFKERKNIPTMWITTKIHIVGMLKNGNQELRFVFLIKVKSVSYSSYS